ncbi:HlyD family efflux transporter periplasmic adaptor subunit [Apibacter muscae]|uniref:HlyD family efflux transporter periplasmic adaptor subunit n=1 Tax=Apibacter muscae TaxID=2509004 RepID=A0A563DI20_9FLAO|nr:HlyD family efflux transporter periplasmic adaptor subunit [Apibacter muscae]TWP29845.1 HlyD family efflux transporter periplasmic adaptor subunit [Apibacter muscae]
MSKYSNIKYTIENLYYKNKVKNFNIYTLVIVVLLVFFILLPIIKVDISTQSRGLVRTESENVPISSVVSGKILFINISNNKNVKIGDTLLVLQASTLEAERQSNISIQGDLNLVLEDLDNLYKGHIGSLKTSEIQKEYQSYLQKKQEATANLVLAKKSYTRNKKLYQEGVISASEFEKYEYELKSAETYLKNLEQQQYALWQTHRREILQQIKSYQGSINQINASKDNYILTSPINGSIMNFIGIQKGSFLNDSQIIAEISAQDGLKVEMYVSANDIGLIQKGQMVNFQIDAYNYNQWGMARGNVMDIDQNITLRSDGSSYFKVWCNLDKDYLTLKNGYKGEIKKGMTLTGRFIINRRSLWNLLYDKVDNWLNPKIIN